MSSSEYEWWRGGVFYQIYPRSYCDASGDGIGDLAGILSKVPYVADLGVDAMWVSPFFKSPMKDFGYDVSDYRDVDPIFGTLADCDALIQAAHAHGLKFLMDHVISHTSDQHAWFVDSRASRDGDKADWYVWAEPRPDGTPPNNWLSLFGGSAWQWDSRRRQYYLHNFLDSQPDLNFHSPAVTAQLLDEVEFWLKRGVDGFRLDTVNFYTHDQALRDNPPNPPGTRRADGVPWSNPYAYQKHIYDKTRPENVAFLKRLRALLDRYPGSTTIGEVGADSSLEVMSEYTSGGDKLHMCYAFDLLTDEFSASHVRRVIEALEASIGDGWPCWSLGNHDVMRVVTRWGGASPDPALARLVMAMVLSLRGSVCIYQGEELGLAEAEVPYDRMQDPYGITMWPDFVGRDGCRTPMPWTKSGAHAGFSEAEPWLPIPDHHRARAVSEQDGDDRSVLNAYRKFLRWRRAQPALRRGSIELIDAPESVLAFVRAHGDDRIACFFNLSAEPVSVPLTRIAGSGAMQPITGHGFTEVQGSSALDLPAYDAYFGRVE